MPSARQSAARIVRILQDAGFESYFAGGCVRDMLLARTPKDFDIATAARPRDIERLLANTKAIGKAFGVIQVRMGRHTFEVATFRTDHDYRDGRRPSSVTFSSAREDALRRDFTINSMFYDPVSEAYLDYAGGIPDIGKKLIRAVGDPEIRFREDHLRMLRAVRFAQSLGFRIEKKTS